MSDQQETTTNTNQPRLCKMGCGFFGSNATGDYCSKCFRQLDDRQKKSVEKSPEPVTPAVVEAVETPSAPKPEASTVEPEVIETPVKEAKASPPTEEAKVTENTAAKVEKKKKKKKKASYKNMMAGMMKGDASSRDIQKEKEDLRKVTGGGAFTKIEKI
mmetsp:Transcript_21373/g.28449  ORF Transcript_21373/g.28449 Transcript_21373/m.28449 type:complete len:159 (+) Transcript_21373:120-596(+)